MPYIQYIDKKLSGASLDLVGHANTIITEYSNMGFSLTLRQLYYQFVSRDLIANTLQEYKRMGKIINDARLGGHIDWEAIEDRTRFVREDSKWDDPKEIIKGCAEQYRIDKWEGQENKPEVWIEKDALVGVIEDKCSELQVPLLSCRGYLSQSEMWAASQRFIETMDKNTLPCVLHLADHDPSGINMTEDIKTRLETFCGVEVLVVRIALKMDQVRKFNPPPNPAKITDTRAKSYISKFGKQSWELDALDPKYLNELVDKSVGVLRDDVKWAERKSREEKEREQLLNVCRNWESFTQGEEK